MALICHPRLIVFDEPTTALDVTTQLDVLAAIKRMIKGENTAALYISHDLAVVSQIADDILVLRHGKAVEAAQTMTLIETPREDYTRRLLSAGHTGKQTTPVADTEKPLLETARCHSRLRRRRTGGVQCQRLAISRADFGRSRRIRQRQVPPWPESSPGFTAFRRQYYF